MVLLLTELITQHNVEVLFNDPLRGVPPSEVCAGCQPTGTTVVKDGVSEPVWSAMTCKQIPCLRVTIRTSLIAVFPSRQDVEIRTNAALYLPQISDLLNRVPRQMLLLLKTNDLLRGIETTLQTRASSSSFLNMSRCCIRALARYNGIILFCL